MQYALWIGLFFVIALVLGFIVLSTYALGRSLLGIVTKKHAPFIPVPDGALPLLKRITPPSTGAIIYDLGCGDGKIVLYLATLFPEATYIGIEYDLLPYLIAKVKTRKHSNITIRFKNIFKEDLTKADILITYLFPELLDKLLPKLEKELKKGVYVYSFDYAFRKKEAQTIEYNEDASLKRGKRMLVYEF
ncbi:MAG: hypothetical protein UT41_C0002G0011 [Candidatus Wolfebacteria bacterium GW2011_GWC2_39_22]|uniref:tRNA (guanine(46)-N(7))-methyltransferase n=1 Tax=Candidatus Wolfebacteria bacterium GW2011_GWC2_39_22 TaxID=1619013 RepID=A0A0G0RF12_9BACT|nr:MAG: hypothetical protein UT41_C0002G0011 [Candidatus Wolfebacteria bacterium GW2011_GWC2_39_22]HBI25872.1 hypothetical protein [Candidatus Wolfebacteria bacterium]